MKKRLRSVTKSVDNNCPHSFRDGWSRRPNPKKQQLINERKALIQQDNRLLLERISDIMQHNNLDQHATTRKYTDRMSNIGGRRAQLRKINTDNKIILQRLQGTTAYYDNRIAAADWKVFRKHLEHMGTYAYKGGGKMNGSVQKILKQGLKPRGKTRRAATASGQRRRAQQRIGAARPEVSGPLANKVAAGLRAMTAPTRKKKSPLKPLKRGRKKR